MGRRRTTGRVKLRYGTPERMKTDLRGTATWSSSADPSAFRFSDPSPYPLWPQTALVGTRPTQIDWPETARAGHSTGTQSRISDRQKDPVLTPHHSKSTAPEEYSGKNIFSIRDKGVGAEVEGERTWLH